MARNKQPAPVSEAAISEVLEGKLDADAAYHLKRKAEQVLSEDAAALRQRLFRVEVVVRMADDMNHPE